MRRVLMPIMGAIILTSGSAHARIDTDWAALVKQLQKSVVTIERNDNGVSCTGFVINPKTRRDDSDVTLIATAAHCEAVKLWADQSEAKVIAKNKEKDLIVLAVDELGRPALKLAAENPRVGDSVASLGYGYGLEKPLFRLTHISAETYIPYEGIGGPLFMTDSTFVPGQSGGAVVNASGEVVMMVQMGTNSVGMGVGAETIREKIGKYFEKTKQPQP
jgi:S1-C subfamily serine protease